jgi:prepilin-type N-terminal cleavage/methylation domain-containing protein
MRQTTDFARRHTTHRRGFTLIEMLVVIAIIGILSSLVAAAAFQVISTRRSGNSELMLTKLDALLQRHWDYVVNQAKTEVIPDAYLSSQFTTVGGNQVRTSWGLQEMADGDTDRARLLWIHLRLRQQFPMTFGEALSPTSQWVDVASGNALRDPAGRIDPTQGGKFVPYLPALAPNRTYQQALAAAGIGTLWAPPSTSIDYTRVQKSGINPNDLIDESSALLLLILQQSRGGASLALEDLGTGATADGIYLGTDGQHRIKQIVDAWGNPIAFYRWPTANPEITRANASLGGTAASKFRDPLDPGGRLVAATWNNYNQKYASFQGVWAFEALFHTLHMPELPPAPYTPQSAPRAYHTRPVLVSAGRNGALGIQGPWMPQASKPVYPVVVPFAPNMFPDPMLRDPNPAIPTSFYDDNLLSSRLRLGARGD